MSVEVSHVAGALVVAIHDVSQLDAVSSFARQLAPTPTAAVVVDVSAMTMAPSGRAELLAERMREVAEQCRSHRCSLVAGRLTARRILRQLFDGTTIGVFPSVNAALSAVPVRRG